MLSKANSKGRTPAREMVPRLQNLDVGCENVAQFVVVTKCKWNSRNLRSILFRRLGHYHYGVVPCLVQFLDPAPSPEKHETQSRGRMKLRVLDQQMCTSTVCWSTVYESHLTRVAETNLIDMDPLFRPPLQVHF